MVTEILGYTTLVVLFFSGLIGVIIKYSLTKNSSSENKWHDIQKEDNDSLNQFESES